MMRPSNSNGLRYDVLFERQNVNFVETYWKLLLRQEVEQSRNFGRVMNLVQGMLFGFNLRFFKRDEQIHKHTIARYNFFLRKYELFSKFDTEIAQSSSLGFVNLQANALVEHIPSHWRRIDVSVYYHGASVFSIGESGEFNIFVLPRSRIEHLDESILINKLAWQAWRKPSIKLSNWQE